MKTLLALLALAVPLNAADEVRNVEVSFFCLKYVPGLETIHVSHGNVSAPVRLSTANLTDPITARVFNGDVIFRKDAIGAESKQPAPAIGKVKIPAGIEKALVVLVPGKPGAAEPYSALVMDRGEKFRLGTYRVINFSPRKIRGGIGRSYVEAASGATGDLELKGEPGAVQGVRFEFEKEGRWNRLTETRCAVRKDRRWLLCVYQDPVTNRVNMRSIPDRTLLLATAAGSDDADLTSTNF
ncbi:MAG: hypothetical protein V4819_09840 [Verrucomicrobiota bacterium]